MCDHLNLVEKDYFGLANWETPTNKVVHLTAEALIMSEMMKSVQTNVYSNRSPDLAGRGQGDQEARLWGRVRVHLQRQVLPPRPSAAHRGHHQVTSTN